MKGLLEEKKSSSVTSNGMDFQKKLFDSLPNYKKKVKQFDLNKVKLEIIEEAAEAKR